MKYQDKDVEELLQYLEDTVPYVQATISPGNAFRYERKDWVVVHEGRVISSRRQLDGIMEKARRLRSSGNGTPT